MMIARWLCVRMQMTWKLLQKLKTTVFRFQKMLQVNCWKRRKFQWLRSILKVRIAKAYWFFLLA